MHLFFKVEGFFCLFMEIASATEGYPSLLKIINSINNCNFKSSENFSQFSDNLTFHRSCNAFFWVILKAVVHRMWQLRCLHCGQVSPPMRELSCTNRSLCICLLIIGIVFPSRFQNHVILNHSIDLVWLAHGAKFTPAAKEAGDV